MQPVIRLLVVSETLIDSSWSSFLFISSFTVKILRVANGEVLQGTERGGGCQGRHKALEEA
jgi:hypothetical protein